MQNSLRKTTALGLLTTHLGVWALIGLSYFGAVKLNALVFPFTFMDGNANMVFLPNGLRVLFMLIFADTAVVGIFMASLLIAIFHDQGPFYSIYELSLVSSLACWAAYRISVDVLKLDVHLNRLTAESLIKCAFIFSVINPVASQLFIHHDAWNPAILQTTLFMILGDFFGALLVLYIAKAISKQVLH